MKNVLFVDDNLMVQEIISSELMATYKVKISSASDTKGALSLLENTLFDFIICDYEMPHGNGEIVLNYVRENSLSVPFIFFTGNYDLKLPIQNPLIEIIHDKSYEKLVNIICKHDLCKRRDHLMR